MSSPPATFMEALTKLYQHYLILPDGILYVEPEGNQVLAVTKKDGQLWLSLLPAANPRSFFVQTAVDLSSPGQLPFVYMQAMLLGLAWANPPRRIAVLGAGGGAIPITLRRYLPAAEIDVVEISPAVIRIAQRFFGLQPDEQLHLHVMDARTFLEQQPAGYDLLLVDAFNDQGITPYRLATVEFYDLCQTCLSLSGVAVINTIANSPFSGQQQLTLQAAFPALAHVAASEHNTIYFGSRDTGLDCKQIEQRTQVLEADLTLPFSISTWAGMMVQDDGDRFAEAGETVFHDGAPPAGYSQGSNE